MWHRAENTRFPELDLSESQHHSHEQTKMMKFLLLFLCICILNTVIAEWNMTQANVAVWLSAAGDCGHENYESHVFQGPTTGFVVTHTIWDYKATEGYVGYLPSENAIYVIFRGTSSVRNDITDALFIKTDYTTYPECNAKVHLGFLHAEQTVAPQVIAAVQKLQLQFPKYEVRVAGHSLGAGLAQLMTMDFIKNGINVTTLHTWGQPRTGKIYVLLLFDRNISLFSFFLSFFQVPKNFLIVSKQK